MTLWIDNGAVLKSSSQWQLKEFRKLNNSGHAIFSLLYCPYLYSVSSMPMYVDN